VQAVYKLVGIHDFVVHVYTYDLSEALTQKKQVMDNERLVLFHFDHKKKEKLIDELKFTT